ncbi:MAG: phosphoribosylglycinamide formyltransferase 2 [Candidatus Methanofastidiosa archaeon]|nr:phosphoribosylglycinamide formyltransferase 2 [Candidatus Methanofastidiosa archaeon]
MAKYERKKRDVLGSPLTKNTAKIMMLGSGELGREVVIEAQRLGIETVAVDRYGRAPAQQVAHRAYTINMQDAGALRSLIEYEKPDAIIPEIEAISLDTLQELEDDGWNIIPNARATYITMHRERSREMITKEAGVKASKYAYARSLDELRDACEKVGYPCWSKAIMSSSGYGSYFVATPEDVEKAWKAANTKARGQGDWVIVEQHIDFDIEVTELAIRHFDENGKIVTTFPKPVGHYQIEGDYHASWQPAEVSEKAEKNIYKTTQKITDTLGGLGLFGCELFVKGDDVWANEISPRPHDTGMVTMMTHPPGFSEQGLHVRAVLGLPVPSFKRDGFNVIEPLKPGASHVIKSPHAGWDAEFGNLYSAMNMYPESAIRFFGKTEARLHRRMGVALALADTAQEAKARAQKIAHAVQIRVNGSSFEPQDDHRMHLEL